MSETIKTCEHKIFSQHHCCVGCGFHRFHIEGYDRGTAELAAAVAERDALREFVDNADAIQFDGRTIIRLSIGWGFRDGSTFGMTALEAFQNLATIPKGVKTDE